MDGQTRNSLFSQTNPSRLYVRETKRASEQKLKYHVVAFLSFDDVPLIDGLDPEETYGTMYLYQTIQVRADDDTNTPKINFLQWHGVVDEWNR